MCLQRLTLLIMNLKQEKLKNLGRMTKSKVIDISNILQPLTVDSEGDFFFEMIGKLSKATRQLIL